MVRSLLFAWGIDEAKCIVVTAICVCLSLTAFPHYCTDLDVTWGNGSCALLGRFAVGARVSLLWEHSAKCNMSASACTRSMHAWLDLWSQSRAVHFRLCKLFAYASLSKQYTLVLAKWLGDTLQFGKQHPVLSVVRVSSSNAKLS